MKLYGSAPFSMYTNFCRIVAKLTSFEHEFVRIAPEDKEKFKAETYSAGLFPYLKDETTGEGIGESTAIARFMANSNPASGLYGSTVYESALIDEAIERHVFANNQFILKLLVAVIGFVPIKEEEFTEAVKRLKEYLAKLDGLLKDKTYFALEKLTLADLYVVQTVGFMFVTLIGAEDRAQLLNLVAWFDRVRANEAVTEILGKPRYIGVALKPKLAE
mmetsp:Transcript_15144/g.17547  ORF Transcript_15144/g.17547 Transcript_15144/m.17547 type:complete len:218 (-) Transcript_15144:37-690(-)